MARKTNRLKIKLFALFGIALIVFSSISLVLPSSLYAQTEEDIINDVLRDTNDVPRDEDACSTKSKDRFVVGSIDPDDAPPPDLDSEYEACRRGYRGGAGGAAGANPKNNTCPDHLLKGLLKTACEDGFDKGKAASATPEQREQAEQTCANKTGEEKEQCIQDELSGAGDEESNECEGGDIFSLRWILCGVIEFALNLSKFFYEEMITPLLENVPISTDPADGAYQAWNSFRALGNILLVGAMLVLVYGVVRGGRQ